MTVAQLAIPLAAAVAAVFAIWFALDILLRTRPGEGVSAAAERTRELGNSFTWRFVALSVTVGLAGGAGFGAAVGAYREGVESGAIAGLAVLAGALAAVVTAGAGAALGQRASERAATAAGRTLRQALAITLWAGTAPRSQAGRWRWREWRGSTASRRASPISREARRRSSCWARGRGRR